MALETWCGKVRAGSVELIKWKTTDRSFLSGSKGYINITTPCITEIVMNTQS